MDKAPELEGTKVFEGEGGEIMVKKTNYGEFDPGSG
jgi:hypothetical protein